MEIKQGVNVMKIMKTVVLSVIMFCAVPLYTGLAFAAEVNINKADAPTLAAELSGIGEKKAQAIIEYRKQNGPFTSVDDLQKVKGISSKTIDKNRKDLSL
jgi:competence protein ComEA